jgi:hypothetical protein
MSYFVVVCFLWPAMWCAFLARSFVHVTATAVQFFICRTPGDKVQIQADMSKSKAAALHAMDVLGWEEL